MVPNASQDTSQVSAPERVKAIVLDFLERAGWSAGQVFFATLLAGGTAINVPNLPWKYALVIALGAAVASAVLTAGQYLARLQDLSGLNLPPAAVFWVDLGLRLVKTFLASLAGSFAAAQPFNIMKFDWTTALNVAALAVFAALAKGLLARGSGTGAAAATVPEAQNPSTLPTSTYVKAVQG
jgi:hypothetical protein